MPLFKPCFDLFEHTLQYTHFVPICLLSYTQCLLQYLGKVMGGICVLHGLIQLSILFSLKNIYFWLCWVFVAECGPSLVVASGGYSLVAVLGLLTAVSSLVAEHRLQAHGLSQLQHVSSLAVLVALRHMGSSWTRDRTHVPCIGRWILNHWTNRETQAFYS